MFCTCPGGCGLAIAVVMVIGLLAVHSSYLYCFQWESWQEWIEHFGNVLLLVAVQLVVLLLWWYQGCFWVCCSLAYADRKHQLECSKCGELSYIFGTSPSYLPTQALLFCPCLCIIFMTTIFTSSILWWLIWCGHMTKANILTLDGGLHSVDPGSLLYYLGGKVQWPTFVVNLIMVAAFSLPASLA